jgi:hypothetical protein
MSVRPIPSGEVPPRHSRPKVVGLTVRLRRARRGEWPPILRVLPSPGVRPTTGGEAPSSFNPSRHAAEPVLPVCPSGQLRHQSLGEMCLT